MDIQYFGSVKNYYLKQKGGDMLISKKDIIYIKQFIKFFQRKRGKIFRCLARRRTPAINGKERTCQTSQKGLYHTKQIIKFVQQKVRMNFDIWPGEGRRPKMERRGRANQPKGYISHKTNYKISSIKRKQDFSTFGLAKDVDLKWKGGDVPTSQKYHY